MKKPVMILMACLLVTAAVAQSANGITLEYCYEKAEQNHPLSAQFELIDQATELKIKNINKNYLPDLSLNGSAHYQSDVTKVPTRVPMPEFQIEPIDKDWYKLSLDVQQTIWDGGLTRRNRLLEETEKQILSQENRVEIYQVKEQVNRAYFNMLAIQENMKILRLHEEVITERMDEVRAAVENGALLQSDLLQLRSELIKVRQKTGELQIAFETSGKVLSELIGEEIPGNAKLTLPEASLEKMDNLRKRPEYGLMDYRQVKLSAMKELASARDYPRFFGFGQVGYGRPGFDMLNNEFDDFYMVGVKLNWSIYGWGDTKNQKEILELNRKMIENQKNNLDRTLSIRGEERLSEIRKYRMLIEKDQEILEIREEITRTYESQLKNGIITSSDYITQLNAESEARLNLSINRIRLVSAIIDYKTTLGDI